MNGPLVAQISQELQVAADRLLPVLGMDLADLARERILAYAPVLAAQLGSGDDNLVAETVIDLMHAIWGQADPPPEWWRTPLGRLVAGSIGRDDAEAVTPSVAAAMLGVSRGRVYQLIEAGKLDRHPDGGVLRSDILQRLAARPQ